MADSVVKASFDPMGSASCKTIITPLIITDKLSDEDEKASRRPLKSCFSWFIRFTVCVCVQLLNLQVRRVVTQSAAGNTARLTPWKPALLGQSKRRFSVDLFWTVHSFNPVTARCPWRKRLVRGRASTPPAPVVCCWTPRRARTPARTPTPPACTGTAGVCTLTWRGCLIRFATTIYRCVIIVTIINNY